LNFAKANNIARKIPPALLGKNLRNAQSITTQPLLLRLDGGNGSIENIDVVLEHNQHYPDQIDVDFLIKWNPRRQDKQDWLEQAEQQAIWSNPRDGKRIGIYSIQTTRHWQGYDYQIRQVIRVIERTIDKHGQSLLIPDIILEGWWTSLDLDEPTIIHLYCDHGTSEQFHSEFKTDLGIERLPSGKFATNALVLVSSVLIYNIQRWIGQTALTGSRAPKRHKAKRRSIKTVMQDMMNIAARVVKTANRIKLSFGKGCCSFEAFQWVYQKLAYG
jgi:hypothetical protein